jgi:phenylalanyl-tRNA synthetase beta subunit
LVENGFYEIYNRSIVKSGAIKLQNSLNSNATAMRETLLSKLKERAEKNLINEQEPKLFEIGKVFVGTLNEDSARERNTVVDEFFSFAGIIGKRKIKEKQKEDLFYRTKGYLENIFDILNIKNIT